MAPRVHESQRQPERAFQRAGADPKGGFGRGEWEKGEYPRWCKRANGVPRAALSLSLSLFASVMLFRDRLDWNLSLECSPMRRREEKNVTPRGVGQKICARSFLGKKGDPDCTAKLGEGRGPRREMDRWRDRARLLGRHPGSHRTGSWTAGRLHSSFSLQVVVGQTSKQGSRGCPVLRRRVSPLLLVSPPVSPIGQAKNDHRWKLPWLFGPKSYLVLIAVRTTCTPCPTNRRPPDDYTT
ncbi:hypothetical protein LZ30DRAFT_711050 [Colletotrichum cereale]|nr:hypothetical protein LZ30DRAFT_711050 [Colletotrichum cereale]